ncbi:chromosome segregation protein SMC [Roseiflexus castenholzii]|uniref:chromosome segregation protein SMC n=1 Tax=Roseiflexus castenholzii TaxID=120962 RepID=UPI003C7B3FCD
MYLRRLEIQGFKTFAGHTLFEFQPGVTAVVGPNGSGKSNLVDAIRWALGEQHPGTLRCKRTEDLIFSGGGRRAPAGFAEVSLTIDNRDRLLPAPYSEVTITRRATRSGENEYFINRQRVRLRDVQEVAAPISGAYAIINQGLVDAALNLRPLERRRLFEDAAAISVYEQRRTDAERRLRETGANVARCADILTELEPRLRSLKRQAALARSHRDLTAELHTLLEQYYAHLWNVARTDCAAAERLVQALESTLAARQAEIAAASATLRHTRDHIHALRNRIGALHAESSALHTDAETVQRTLAVGQERLTALTRQIEDQEHALRDLDHQRTAQQADQEAAAAHLAGAEQRLAQIQQEYSAYESRRAERLANRALLRQALDEAHHTLMEIRAALGVVQRQMEQIADQYEHLIRERAVAEESLAAAQETLAARRHESAQAEAQVAALERELADAALRTEQARGDVEHRRRQRAAAAETLEAARRRQMDLEARLETLRRLHHSYAGTFAGVRAAMQWAEAQRRTGFALVATLLRVPAELETAIEVALGSRLQNIVVDHWEDAEAAIEALKRSGEGRATFLPLDTIRARGSNGGRAYGTVDPDDGVLGVAANLIDVDERYRPIADMLLGRTLVVRSLAVARRELSRIGGGWTMVTLAGEQVSAAGAVTGGAAVKESGTLRRERELRELPERLEAATRAVEQAHAHYVVTGEAYAAAEQMAREAERQQRQVQRNLDQERAAAAQAQRAVDRADAERLIRQRRIEQIDAEMTALLDRRRSVIAEHEDLTQREAAARAQVDQLQAQEAAQRAEDAADDEALAVLRARRADAEGEVRALRAVLHTGAQALARSNNQRRALEERIERLHHERKTLTHELTHSAARHQALLEQIDALRARIDPAEAELTVLEQQREEHETRTQNLTGALIDAESAYNRATIDAQRARDRLETLRERAAGDGIDIEAAARSHPEPLPDGNPDTLHQRIIELKQRIARLGDINPLALEEYDEAAARYEFLSSQMHDLRAASATLNELIAELDTAIRTRFETTFRIVAAEFERSFTRLFGGGEARLVLINDNGGDDDDQNDARPPGIASLGVDIIARPPGKRQQHLALLSGGERALTAAALLFAILKANPTPFCVLDEVDAALDEANIGRFRDALTELSEKTQFIVVTHNRGTIEAADTIYGITMGDDGASRVLSLRIEEIDRP